MNELIRRIRIPSYVEQLQNVSEAIKLNQLVYGPHLQLLENQLCALFDKRHAVLTANGFSALFLALKAAVPDRASILTASATTCFAVVNAIRGAGHDVRFADLEISSASLQMPCKDTKDLLCVVPDHFGFIAPACRNWSKGAGLLIEDACQSFLSRATTHTDADVVVVSFYPTKMVNGIDGGAILTDDASIYERARKLCSYEDQVHPEREPRYNLKMNNINAAMVLATLPHLEQMGERMLDIYRSLTSELERAGIEFLKTANGEVPTRLMVVAGNKEQKSKWVQVLTGKGIEASSELLLMCSEEGAQEYPVAKCLVESTFSIPLHPLLEDQEVMTINKGIAEL